MSLSQLYQPTSSSKEKQSSSEIVPSAKSRRRGGSRAAAWWLPVILVAAFVALFAFVFRDRLLPAISVDVERAILLSDIGEAAGGESGGEAAAAQPSPLPAGTGDLPDFSSRMLFQAAGWLEPDPLPIRATALTDGVVAKVHVLEGQSIKRGELIAELISEDAELALRSAERAKDAITAEHHMHLAQIPSVEAEAAGILDQSRAAQVHLAELNDTKERLDKLSAGTVSAGELIRARLAAQAQEAEIDALHSQHRGALAKLKAIETQSEVFEAKIAAAAVTVEERKLALDRTKISSPVDGVVLELKAAPGQKKMLGMDDPDSATVAVLFETGRLQARVDVPLADARGLVPGQAALVTTDFLPNTEFRGIVTRIVGAADLQRNTLQAKVRVIDPDPRLRPEMLCRVKFLETKAAEVRGAGSRKESATGTAREDVSRAVMVPRNALAVGDGDSAVAWVVADDGDRAERRQVVMGRLRREGYVSVRSGILAGENLILPPFDELTPGRRIRVRTPNKD